MISGKGKATDFKFGGCIYRAYSDKSPLKIFEKRKRGRIQRLSKFFWVPPIISGTGKANFVGTFIGSIGTKAQENVGKSGRGRISGSPENFQGTHM